MGTKSGIIISPCEKNGAKQYCVNVPISFAGRRMRKFFEFQADAVRWMHDFEDQVKVNGTRHLETTGKTVSQVLKSFWALKKLEGRHLATAQHILGNFATKHGSAPIDSISPLQLHRYWTREGWGSAYRMTIYRYLRLFFNWAERYDFLDKNPIRRVEVPESVDPVKQILTPEKMAEYLQIEDPIFHAYLCLGGFAGLRTSEIVALRDGDISAKEIHVRGGKTGERFVKILPTFKRHWWTRVDVHQSRSRFHAHIRRVVGAEWPDNCLRHSFGTYHAAMWEDISKTAFQMGNSEAVCKKAYLRAKPRAVAVDWWNL